MSDTSAVVRIGRVMLQVLLVFATYALLLALTDALFSTASLVRMPSAGASASESILRLPAVALASTGVLSFIVLRARCSGASLALRLGLGFFALHTLQPMIEAVGWSQSSARDFGDIPTSLFAGAVFAGLLAPAAVVILGRSRPDPQPAPPQALGTASLADWSPRLGAAVLAYLVIYFGLGCWVGWYPSGRAVCDGGSNLLFTAPGLLWIEAIRGLLWALIAILIVQTLRRGVAEASLTLGVLFALAAPVHRLLPSPAWLGDGASDDELAYVASHFVLGVLLASGLTWTRWPTATVHGAPRGLKGH
jgi:hypothetical protein